MKINYEQLSVKIHYFFFMAAMGPILPFLPVYGKQLGVSPIVMGSITAVLPILFLMAKPAFGFLVDHFYTWRKSIFITLLATTSSSFIFIYFVPKIPTQIPSNYTFIDIPCLSVFDCEFHDAATSNCVKLKNVTCRWMCGNESNVSFTERINEEDFVQQKISPNALCLIYATKISNCSININNNCTTPNMVFEDVYNLYTSVTFWSFVLLMSLGTIGFNISNCISDAICFDVLGEGGQMGYGRQRVWGTIGFGISAFLTGYAIDWCSQDDTIKSYTPAFIFVIFFSALDLLCCRKLKLPIMSESTSIVKDVYSLLKLKPIFIFLCFATLAGIFDSFLIYFLFWYLEDLSKATGYMSKIKLIEGLIVAAETLGGEVIFFSLSGKILKKIGYGYSFAFCLLCYAIRLTLISLASTPWWVIPIEFVMQGPTYALCYTTIVAYASAVSPPGTSATVQGIVAGMDDGLGYAIGSLIGGILYKEVGGVVTLRIFATIAMLSSITYVFLHIIYLKHTTPDTRQKVEWKSPENANMECIVAEG